MEKNPWVDNPLAAFEAFLASPDWLMYSRRPQDIPKDLAGPKPPRLRESTRDSYLYLFHQILTWLDIHPRGRSALVSLTASDIESFLESRDGNRRIRNGATVRRQYLAILERIYLHLAIEPNPARELAIAIARNRADLAGRHAETASLAPDSLVLLYDYLRRPSDTQGRKSWTDCRDRALVAILAGGGLKVNETIGLYVDNVGKPDTAGLLTVHVPSAAADGTSIDHDTQLQPPATDLVSTWIAHRAQLGIPGQFLFPSTATGKQMTRRTATRIVAAAIAGAGIDIHHKGARTLRNTYAVNALLAGDDVGTIKERLGLQEQSAMATYTTAAVQLQQKLAASDNTGS